jgi:hypothetical protein
MNVLTKLEDKLLASELFKNKKDSYTVSLPVVFKSDRLSDHDNFKSMPKHKQDLIKNKSFIQDANEKELVSLWHIFG